MDIALSRSYRDFGAIDMLAGGRRFFCENNY